ncbi:MAG: alpha/beta fold hydrolase [Bacteroidales bacterium]|nr:alpha/beta fold hydrolase [Bacteroidales bacterium]
MKNIVLLFLIISLNSYGQNELSEGFKKTAVKIGDTRFELYKGKIKVKINRADSASGYLSLPIFIYKSPSETPAEPIVYMSGGPGQTNFDHVPPGKFLANHDYIFIGYRGVDGSVQLKSKKLNRSMKGRHFKLMSDESLDYMGSCMQEYLKDITGRGIDISNYTMIDVIDDFEEVRKLLGYSKINLYSASYGTRVALLYSYRYPDVIKRSLMVGVNPPGHFVWWPENTERIIKKYDSIYATQSNGDNISIEESIRLAFLHMPARWSFFRLDADKIKAASFLLLYGKSSAVMAFDAYRNAALKKDYSGLYLMQLAYDYLVPKKMGAMGDCISKSASADFDPELNYRQLFRPDSLTIGAPMSMLTWGGFGILPIKMIDEEYRKPRISLTETLMISGNLDNTNPSEIAREKLLPWLPNGKQIILKDMSHCGDLMWLQRDAYKHMVLRYFDEGIVDTSLFRHDPVSFEPKKSFNKMAKVYYPVVFLGSLIY